VRAVSVYREGSREGILIFEDPITHKKKYDNNTSICIERPENIEYHCAPKRPSELDCEIHHTTVKGEKWLVILGLLENKPYELFAGEQEDLYLPKSVKEGVIKKNGGGKYSLLVKIKKNEVEYKNIADILMSSEQKALTRMISISLRHGVPVEFIT
jgi:ribonucleoside-diphosphate reductase alpha chain